MTGLAKSQDLEEEKIICTAKKNAHPKKLTKIFFEPQKKRNKNFTKSIDSYV